MRLNLVSLSLMITLLALAGCASAPEPAPEPEVTAETETSGPMLTGDEFETDNGNLVVQPLNHATFAMGWNGQTIYVDPVGGAELFEGLPRPDLILVTDVHGDHFDAETLGAVATAETAIVAPAAIVEQLPAGLASQAQALANGSETSLLGLTVEAIPMYNLTQDRLQFHEMGRGNGYVLTMGGKRVYVSGDTEDVPEMRALENIDIAFVCFNLPYTMTENQAASAVVEFRPAIVYPYHYGESDVDLFAELVAEGGGDIEVRRGAWY